MAADYTLQLRSNHVQVEQLIPACRSAHNCVQGPNSILYLTAGDSGLAGQRYNDVWQLSQIKNSSSKIYSWKQVSQQTSDQHHEQGSSSSCCTARSNAAAAATAGWLFLFGGWDSSGLRPLAQLEAFSFESQIWCDPNPTGSGPSPRGQPAAAANTAGTAVYFFGGWDGSRRFNDLHKLVLNGQGQPNSHGQPHGQGPNCWAWEEVTPRPAPPKGARAGITFQQQQAVLNQPPQQQQQQQEQQELTLVQQQQQLQLPCERSDHVMVCWHYCDDGVWKDLLVVFGGSCSSGLLNDTWLFDINTSSWTQAYHGGAAPCARSSCAATITGDILLLHGGQTPAGVLQDMHLLNLSTLTWLQVDLGPVLQPLCRHSMVVSDSNCLIFGGYDGSTATNRLLQIDLQPVQQLQRSSLQDLIYSMACCGSACGNNNGLAAVADKGAVLGQAQDAVSDGDDGSNGAGTLKAVGVVPRAAVLPVPAVVKALSKKAAPVPLQLSDLPNAEEVAAMPQWKQVRQLHQAALAAGCEQYIDPKTGYTVFTAKYLQQRQCCGNKCRHCPHGWVNVSKQRLQPAAAAAAAPPEW